MASNSHAPDAFVPHTVSQALALASMPNNQVIEGVPGLFNSTASKSRLIYFSQFPEVQAVRFVGSFGARLINTQTLGNMPLAAIGILALAIALISITSFRFNPVLLHIVLAGFVALIASILSLADLLSCEGTNSQVTNLMVANGIFLAHASLFKFLYLLRQSEQPGHLEVPQVLSFGNDEVKEGGPVSSDTQGLLGQPKRESAWQTVIREERSGLFMHSGSWNRFGLAGRFARWLLYAMVVVAFIVDLVWRILFVVRGIGNGALELYKASAGMQVTILILVGGQMFLQAVSSMQPTDARTNFLHMSPVFLGIAIAFGLAVTELSVINFEDTPLGRLLFSVELFVFLVHALSMAFNYPHDNWHLNGSTLPRVRADGSRVSFLPPVSISTFRASPPGDLAESVRTGPIIRRASQAPSWVTEVAKGQEVLSRGDDPSIASSQNKEEDSLRSRDSSIPEPGEDETRRQSVAITSQPRPPVRGFSIGSIPEPDSPVDVAIPPSNTFHRRNPSRTLPMEVPPKRKESRPPLTINPHFPNNSDLSVAATGTLMSVGRQISNASTNLSIGSRETKKAGRPSYSTVSMQSVGSEFSVSQFPLPPSPRADGGLPSDIGSMYQFDTVSTPEATYRPSSPHTNSRRVKVEFAEFQLVPPPSLFGEQRPLSAASLSSAASLGIGPPGQLDFSDARNITSFIAQPHRRQESNLPVPAADNVKNAQESDSPLGAVPAPPSPVPSVLEAKIVAVVRMPSLQRRPSLPQPPVPVTPIRTLPSSPRDVRKTAASSFYSRRTSDLVVESAPRVPQDGVAETIRTQSPISDYTWSPTRGPRQKKPFQAGQYSR